MAMKVPVKGQIAKIRPVKFREEVMCGDLMELYKIMLAIMRSQGLLSTFPSDERTQDAE